MPKLSRWFVKSALVSLVLGCLLAGLALSGSTLPLPPAVVALRPLAWHLLTLGWATQLIFGVAFWMFPLTAKPAATRPGAPAPAAGQRRGDERLGWTAFALLNGGLALRAVGEPAGALFPGIAAGPLLPLAAVCQVAAILIFVTFTWPRVRPLGR